MPKVSVILPIFNVEKYLPNALKSLKEQKLKDLEIICINNGSSDSSQEIVNEFQKNNLQVVSISHAPRSIGAARNEGLSIATGEYIAFLDPDDTFNTDALYLLYEKAKKHNIDTILYSYQKMDENYNLLKDGEVRVAKHIGNISDKFQSDKPFTWEEIKTKVFGIDGKFWAGWTKFVNTNFLRKNNIKFSDCSLCEDHIFTLKLLLKAKTLGYIDEPTIYNYMVRQNSASRKKDPTDDNLKVKEVFKAIKTLLLRMKLQKNLEKEFKNYIETIKKFMLPKIESQNKFETDCAKIITDWEKFCKK
ncbi:glycosyltransferase [bacterium]|nr:glycosyltransferase [bacterium]